MKELKPPKGHYVIITTPQLKGELGLLHPEIQPYSLNGNKSSSVLIYLGDIYYKCLENYQNVNPCKRELPNTYFQIKLNPNEYEKIQCRDFKNVLSKTQKIYTQLNLSKYPCKKSSKDPNFSILRHWGYLNAIDTFLQLGLINLKKIKTFERPLLKNNR